MEKGFVTIAGAGPGDPGLITQKALEALRDADCVVYDFLANPEMLAGLTCEKIYVGKQGSRHTMSQEEINRLLVAKAREGKTVVRLKGGDPYIFGRGGEEAEELVRAGVPFIVIPGISSFYSVPAYAGIPLTHRDHANAFEVITGHRRDDASDGEDINLPDFNDKKTFVFLMGVKNLGQIAARLIAEKGFPADIPAGIISWGTTPAQRSVTGPLSAIAELSETNGMQAPAVILIGRVVSLRESLRWFDTLPLFGKRIVVTRTREQASGLSRRLAALGAGVVEFPTIEIRPKPDLSPLRKALEDLPSFDWIVFTSQNAVGIFFGALEESGRDSRDLHRNRIAAIGPATAKEIGKYNITPDLVPPEYVAESLVEAMGKTGVAGKRVLLPCAQEARDALRDGLAALGAMVERIPVYDTVPPGGITGEALSEIKSADIITFTSSSTARNFFRLVSDTKAALACIGPVTADAVRDAGYQPLIVASEYTIEGLVRAILESVEKK